MKISNDEYYFIGFLVGGILGMIIDNITNVHVQSLFCLLVFLAVKFTLDYVKGGMEGVS